MPNSERGTVALNMRVDIKKRNLIDAAVSALGVDRTSFMVDAALTKAREVLLDQRLFVLDDVAFDQFEKALDASPIGENQCLQQFLQRPKRWASPRLND